MHDKILDVNIEEPVMVQYTDLIKERELRKKTTIWNLLQRDTTAMNFFDAEERHYVKDVIAYEKAKHIVLLPFEDLSEDRTLMSFAYHMSKLTEHGVDLVKDNVKDLTNEEKVLTLQQVKERYEGTVKDRPIALCDVSEELLNEKQIDILQYVFLMKCIRKELKKRNYTKRVAAFWLSGINDIETRINFLTEIVNFYKK